MIPCKRELGGTLALKSVNDEYAKIWSVLCFVCSSTYKLFVISKRCTSDLLNRIASSLQRFRKDLVSLLSRRISFRSVGPVCSCLLWNFQCGVPELLRSMSSVCRGENIPSGDESIPRNKSWRSCLSQLHVLFKYGTITLGH